LAARAGRILNIPARQRRRFVIALTSGLALLLLSVAYGRVALRIRDDLQGSSHAAVQEAALEIVRPVIYQVVSYGAPPAEQIWGRQTVRPLTTETASTAFERESLALAESPLGTVHSSWQRRDARTFVEFAIADGRGGVATTEVEVRGGLAALEARFQRFYAVASATGLVGSALLVFAVLVIWLFRATAPRKHASPVQAAMSEAGHETLSDAWLVRAARAGADGHWELDYDGERFWRSGTFEELLGRAPHDAIGTIEEFERIPHPDDTERVRLVFEQHVEIGAPFEVELRLQCANGAWRWFRYRGAGEFVQGTMIRFSGSVSDIEHERMVREGLGRLRKLASEVPNARRAG
jgi:PAS domain S-box-containing protein